MVPASVTACEVVAGFMKRRENSFLFHGTGPGVPLKGRMGQLVLDHFSPEVMQRESGTTKKKPAALRDVRRMDQPSG
jgi:hypothetical protein